MSAVTPPKDICRNPFDGPRLSMETPIPEEISMETSTPEEIRDQVKALILQGKREEAEALYEEASLNSIFQNANQLGTSYSTWSRRRSESDPVEQQIRRMLANPDDVIQEDVIRKATTQQDTRKKV